MVKFTEEGYQQLLRNQANAERELKKPQPKRKKAATNLLGAKPKPMPSDAPVKDKTGRVVNVCPVCGARWDDSKTCSHATKNRRQFTSDGVDMFHCFCKPLRSFERYKK